MSLIDPFTETVVFGKRYPVAVPPPRSTVIATLRRTGGHRGDGQALSVSHGKGSSGGKVPGLERYTGKGKRSPVHNPGGFKG